MRLSLLFIMVMSLFVSACGWQLRGTQTDQKPLPTIHVVSDDTFAPITRSVREALQKQADDTSADALYTLRILKEDIDKRAVTYNSSGTPAQYEMTLTITYVIQDSSIPEPALPRTAAAHRIFDFDPRNVVAKSEEERALLQHMRQQLAQRLVNEISRRHNATPAPSADSHE